MDDVALFFLLLTVCDVLASKRPRSTPRKQLPKWTPEPGPDNLGTHPLPPNPLERK